jgi:hypothetical protein
MIPVLAKTIDSEVLWNRGSNGKTNYGCLRWMIIVEGTNMARVINMMLDVWFIF